MITCFAVGISIAVAIACVSSDLNNEPPKYKFLSDALPERCNETTEEPSIFEPCRRKFYYYSMQGSYEEIGSNADQELIRLGFGAVGGQARTYRRVYVRYQGGKRYMITIIDKAWLNAAMGSGLLMIIKQLNGHFI